MVRDWLYWIWFAEAFGPGVDCRAVIEEYGEPRAFYNEGENVIDELRRRGRIKISTARADRIRDSFNEDSLDDAKRILDKVYRLGLKMTVPVDGTYPKGLRRISAMPILLYIKGELTEQQNDLMIGVVGSRKCSAYSLQRTKKLCRELAGGGAIVVSGLAEGIDTAAAQAALQADKKTIAVVGCGLDRVYPACNRGLFEKVAQNGAVISEYAPGTPPRAMNFPQRNRIISGMSSGVVVVEAGSKSGALITAKDAEKQNRDVFVLDCFEDSNSEGDFQGCRLLALRGANKIAGASDIFEYYGQKAGEAPDDESFLWEDRYLAGEQDCELYDFDEPEWLAKRYHASDINRGQGDSETGDGWHHPKGVRIVLPERGWPEPPICAADPKTKKFNSFLKSMSSERGIYGGTVITFDRYNEDEVTDKKSLAMRKAEKISEPAKRKNTNIMQRESHIKAERTKEEAFFDPDLQELSELARTILKELSDIPIGLEELSGMLDVRVDKLAAALAELEISGFVKSIPGARYMLIEK
ncbi:MAG: DNA-protecting protein DprA [Ruminococcaceae bacterium]|nr:DNA-protecting protein DprA [Oscillospiraceae bacterium]